MKVAAKTNISTANSSGKGFRQSKAKAKASTPAVTSIVWRDVTQSSLDAIARQKLGKSKTNPLPTSTDEVNKIAFSCYSAKELPFVLQGLGFTGSSYPSMKAELVKLAVDTFRAVSHLKNGAGDASSMPSNAGPLVTATQTIGTKVSAAASGSGTVSGTSNAANIDVDSSAFNHSSSASLVSISPTAATKKHDATDCDIKVKSSLGNSVTSNTETVTTTVDGLPGWSKISIRRKNGSRSDSYYLSPPAPGSKQVKFNSLKKAKQYHLSSTTQSNEESDASSVDSDDICSDDNAACSSVVDDDQPVMPPYSRRAARKDWSIFDSSESENESIDVNVKTGAGAATLPGYSSDLSDESEPGYLMYSCFPSKSKTPHHCALTYNRRAKEFFDENSLVEFSSGVDGLLPVKNLLPCIAQLFEVNEPDNIRLTTAEGLLRVLKKEMRKPVEKTASAVALTLYQKHALSQLIEDYNGGKAFGLRTTRFHVIVLCAISKLLNKSFILISPPLDGETSVGVLHVSPFQFHDFVHKRGPDYFPSNEDDDLLELEVEKSSHINQLHLDRDSVGDAFVIRAVMNFELNKVHGFHAAAKLSSEFDLTNTDSDDEVTDSPLMDQKKSSKSVSSDGEGEVQNPYVTPKAKKPKYESKTQEEKSTSLLSTVINPYKSSTDLLSGKSTMLSAADKSDNGHHGTSGSIELKVGWGSSPRAIEKLSKSLNTSSAHASQNNSGGKAVLEVTHGVTDRSTGELVHMAIFSFLPSQLWWLKGPPVNTAFELFFAIAGPAPLKPPASCYSTFSESFIRSARHGKNSYMRKGRIVDGQLPYPVKKVIFEIRSNPSGFPLQVVVKKFESNLRSMCSDGSVLAAYTFDHLESTAPGLLSGFLDGKFKKGSEKNVPYTSEQELKDFFKHDIEQAFKLGFARVELNINFDKYFCDFTIQQFLISLGYNSFEEMKDEERSNLYKYGRFPVWQEISEEGISGSV